MGIRVPQDRLSVAPAARPRGTIGTRARLDTSVGDALTRAGRLAAREYQEERQKANRAALRDAELAAMEAENELLYDPDNGFMNKEGDNAFRARKPTVDSYDARMMEIAENIRDADTREEFTQRLGRARRLGFMRNVNGHTSSEREKFEVQSLQSLLTTSAQTAGRNAQDQVRVLNELAAQRNRIEQFAADNGMPAERKEEMIRASEAATHDAVLQGLVNQENYGLAEQYFENQAKGQMRSADEARWERTIESGSLNERAQVVADEAMASVKESGDYSRQNEEQVKEQIRKEQTGRLRDQSIQRVEARFQDQRQAEAADIKQATNEATVQIIEANNREAALTIANQAPEQTRLGMLKLVDSLYKPVTEAEADPTVASAQDQTGLARVRELIDISRRLPDGAQGKLDSEIEVIQLGADLGLSAKAIRDAGVYFRDSGNEGSLKQTMVKQAMEQLTGGDVNERQLSQGMDWVAATMEPGEKATLVSVKKSLANAIMDGAIVQRTTTVGGKLIAVDDDDATALEAFTEDSLSTFLPNIQDDAELANIRAQMTAKGLNPDPPGEGQPDRLERMFKRSEIMGLPEIGESLAQRDQRRAILAQQGIAAGVTLQAAQGLKQARVDRAKEIVDSTLGATTVEVRGKTLTGEPAALHQLHDAAQRGVIPIWMMGAMRELGIEDRFTAGMPSDPADRASYIETQGARMLELLNDARR